MKLHNSADMKSRQSCDRDSPQTAAVFHPWRCVSECPDGPWPEAAPGGEWHPALWAGRGWRGTVPGYVSAPLWPGRGHRHLKSGKIYLYEKKKNPLHAQWKPLKDRSDDLISFPYLNERPMWGRVEQFDHHRQPVVQPHCILGHLCILMSGCEVT